MYNEFAPKHYKGKCPCTTADTLFLLVLSILTLESVHSIRFFYQHFLSGIPTKSLNTFYHACSYAKVDDSHFMNITANVMRIWCDQITQRSVCMQQDSYEGRQIEI